MCCIVLISMNQKRVFIDWFNVDSMGWLMMFREYEIEKQYHSFYQVPQSTNLYKIESIQ